MHSQSHPHPHHHGKVKEEEYYLFGKTSSYPTTIAFAPPPPPPQPLEVLAGVGPPPFLTKTYEIVDDPVTNHVVSWNGGSNGFVVWDAHAFSAALLSKYFKHNNFSSFIRQLNTYGFKKVDPDRWEFANECFLRGQKHLFKNIRRRKTPPSSFQPSSILNNQKCIEPCVGAGSFRLDGEINQLKHDKQVLMSDLVKLRQQQQKSRTYLQDMEQRLKKTESKQRQMMSFLAKAVRNPGFLRQLVERRDKKRGIEAGLEKKRRRTIDQAPSDMNRCEVSNFEVAEVEMFDDVGLKGASDGRMNELVEQQQQQQGIWEDFMNGRVEEEMGLGLDVVAFEDVDVLIDGLQGNNVANLDYTYGSK